MTEISKDFLWTEKYRPKTVDDTILPVELKNTFKKFVEQKNIPNLLLTGTSGIGKTTVARAMVEELGCDYIIINGSLNGNIDTLRNEILNFASTVSLVGGRKYVILDEADYLNCLEENEEIQILDEKGNVSYIALKDMDSNKEYSVVSFNMDTGDLESDRATIVSDKEAEVFDVELDDGRHILVTSDHPFIVDNMGQYEEKTIDSGLSPEDCVVTKTSSISQVKIKSITPVGKRRVVNLSVEKNHTFLTKSGIITHNCNSTQPALRNFMEEFSSNCGFILTCNFKNKIIEPLHSRCSVIDMHINAKSASKLASQFMKRVEHILTSEGVEFDRATLAQVIQKHYPDWRRVLNELQRYSATGKIDSGILNNFRETSIKELIGLMKDKNYTEVRKWVKANIDTDVNALYNEFYETASQYFTARSIPALVVTVAKYQYQNAFSANPEINFAAFLAEAMVDLEFA